MTDTKLRRVPCPQCRKTTPWQDNPFRPFCSDRCKTIDLAAWGSEKYRVPAALDPSLDELDFNLDEPSQ
ncbi:MAG: DNA gyrase inhibitor YacG [SAR324 cluster bacterium]|nr:DNA gyrase inhibitor YacG [SAR324 cluster bacterium]MBF0350696.1 DNA gyrase inhibitor YacG [SAR324 cluster bacterium]